MRFIIKTLLLGCLVMLLFIGQAYAIEPIPEESGFSGFLSIGGGYSRVKSNMIAGNTFGDVGHRSVDSLTDSPDSSSAGSFQFNYDLRYTFASTRTQLFLGTDLKDLIRFDSNIDFYDQEAIFATAGVFIKW